MRNLYRRQTSIRQHKIIIQNTRMLGGTMRSINKIGIAVLSALFLFAPAKSFAQETEITTAWQSEHEAFLPWYAKKMNWDKEEGISLKMLHFQSGDAIAKAVNATDWAVAGIGMKPALTSLYAHKLLLIGIANNESSSNAIYVHKDSPMLATKGQLADYPEVSGSKDLIKGKTVLYTQNTSADFLLDTWLNLYGLTIKDIQIKSYDPRAALGAFKAGMGDILATWSPYTLEAEKNNLVQIANGASCKIDQYVFLVANMDYSSQHPENIEKVLKVCFKTINWMQTADPNEVAKEYMQFYKEWVGQELDLETALLDLKLHPIYSLDQQLELFALNDGQSKVKSFLSAMIDYYSKQGEIKSEDLPRLQRLDNVSDNFLKAIQE